MHGRTICPSFGLRAALRAALPLPLSSSLLCLPYESACAAPVAGFRPLSAPLAVPPSFPLWVALESGLWPFSRRRENGFPIPHKRAILDYSAIRYGFAIDPGRYYAL